MEEGAKVQNNDTDDLVSKFIPAISPNLEKDINIQVSETFRATDRT